MMETLENSIIPAMQATGLSSSSPSSSVTAIGLDGEIHLSEAGLKYVAATFVSEDDPYFVLSWIHDGVMDALDAANGGLIPNLPNPPPYLDVTSPE
jgi:hypothetical protein